MRSLELADLVYLKLRRPGSLDAEQFKEALMQLELAKVYASLATG